jgi:RNA polymerase sigma-70 factor (ECF subfamily)
MDDERLLERASSGDEAAFALLYERHRRLVFGFAYRFLQSKEIAEEITQDCFLSLFKDPRRFKFEGRGASLRTYLCAAARNLAFKRLRLAQRETDMDEEPPPSGSQEPLRRLLALEASEAVRRAVGELPPLQREALILFEYEELSLAEIAEITGVETGAVKARLHRARQRLRTLLAPYFEMDSEKDEEIGAERSRL